ncbi:MAG: glucosaminidase domain-containing protein [Bacteroidota bacterium]
MSCILFANDGDKRYSRAEYIQKWKDVAISNMEKYGIPASITLAQGILESGDGNSMLAKEANNHFGIKCHGWKGKKVFKDDDAKDECFRKYKSAADSYADHSEFLQKQRYAFLFDLKVTDYKGWAKGLKKAGYATNPKYPQLLIGIIEKNDLHKYDQKTDELMAVKKEHKSKKYKVKRPAKESTEVISFSGSTRSIELHTNRIKYVIAQEGDNAKSIAADLDMAEWQIKKYNDVVGGRIFEEGDIIFIQPKRNKSKPDYHIVEHGENLWELSQQYGVKLKKIAQYNSLSVTDDLLIGMKLWLKKPPDIKRKT